MGKSMMRPDGSAINPRIPDSWVIGPNPPLVEPETAIIAMGP